MALFQRKRVQRCLFCTILPMPAYASAILAAGWFFWLTPFLLIKRNPARGAKLDRRARWGVLLEALAYSMLWWGKFWTRPPQDWRIVLSIFLFLFGGLLSWASGPSLGLQLPIVAGLNPDPQLV